MQQVFMDEVLLQGSEIPALYLQNDKVHTRHPRLKDHTNDNELLELCPTISRTSVEGALRQLIKEGAIIRHGSGRATFYTRND